MLISVTALARDSVPVLAFIAWVHCLGSLPWFIAWVHSLVLGGGGLRIHFIGPGQGSLGLSWFPAWLFFSFFFGTLSGTQFSAKVAPIEPTGIQNWVKMRPKTVHGGAQDAILWFSWFRCHSQLKFVFLWLQGVKNQPKIGPKFDKNSDSQKTRSRKTLFRDKTNF